MWLCHKPVRRGLSPCVLAVYRARVAFGVECLVNCEDDVAVFERGSGCVDGSLEGGGDVADDEGSLALAFVNPRGGLAAVGRVADDGVVLYWLAVRRPVEAERTLTVIDPFLCVGTVEADQRSRIGCCARRRGLADRLVGEERGVLRDSEFVEGLEACTHEDAGVGEVVDAVLVVVAGL